MRETVKFAIICVSLLIAAHADAVGQRTQISALDFQERGVRLRLELERAYQDLRHTGEFKSAGNDVSSIVQKYVPVGTSFANAEITLLSSGLLKFKTRQTDLASVSKSCAPAHLLKSTMRLQRLRAIILWRCRSRPTRFSTPAGTNL